MKKYAAMILLTAVILGVLWNESPVKAEKNRIPVEVYECSLKNIKTTVFFTGKVESRSETAIYLSKAADIHSVCVETGDRVMEGDLLFYGKINEDHQTVISGKDVVSVMSGAVNTTGTTDIVCDPDEEGVYAVTSPMDGYIKTLTVSEGNTAGTLVPCVIITAADALEVKAEVPEEYIQSIQKNLPCEITGEAFDGKTYHGTVQSIMPYARTGSILTGNSETVVDVIVSMDDADESLRAGYSTRIEVETGGAENVLTVPYKAVDQDENGDEFVYVVDNGIARKRYITAGTELTDTVEVKYGLTEGDAVILNKDEIKPETRVKVMKSENN